MMSGTSVDGIDVAVAEIAEPSPTSASETHSVQEPQDEKITIEQLSFATVPWPEEMRQQIFALFHEATTAAALCRANFAIANIFADVAMQALDDASIDIDSIDLIASHGQTIWHDVLDGQVTSTLQLGDPSVIAARTGITTIGNFRTADVAAGGQGAPLVSLYDWYFLRPPQMQSPGENETQQGFTLSKNQSLDQGSSFDSHHNRDLDSPFGWRAVQNIGGIGNVTFLPPYGSSGVPLAFDTGPGNVFIDWATEQATGGHQQFDKDGQLATSGQISIPLLAHCLTLPYFHRVPPKSTGRELFDNNLAAEWWAVAQELGASAIDFIATMTELTAITIADAYRRFAPGPIIEVVLAGGGARNPLLRKSISQQLQLKFDRSIPVYTHQEIGINDKAKEALAFALMGYLALHGKPGNVPSCTGADKAQILGQIAPGDNYRLLLQRIG